MHSSSGDSFLFSCSVDYPQFFPFSFEIISIKMSLHMTPKCPQVYQLISTLLQVNRFSFSISLSKSEITSCKLSYVLPSRNQVQWCSPGILELGKWKQEDQNFKVILSYTMTLSYVWTTHEILSPKQK